MRLPIRTPVRRAASGWRAPESLPRGRVAVKPRGPAGGASRARIPAVKISSLARNLKPDASGIWSSAAHRALSYPAHGNRQCFQLEDGSFWFRHRNDCIVAALRRHPPPGPLLDVGGGNGFVTRRLLDEGLEAALLEPGPVGALNARKRRGIPEVLCATLEDCGFPGGSLAAVGLFDVLEHIEDDRAFLDELHTLLQPRGMLYLTVPAFGWLWSASDVGAGHRRRYHPRELVRALSAGFELLLATCFFRALTLPVLALRAAPFRLGLGRGALLSAEAEHGSQGGPAARALQRLLATEPGKIAAGEAMSWGTSCLCVARKREA